MAMAVIVRAAASILIALMIVFGMVAFLLLLTDAFLTGDDDVEESTGPDLTRFLAGRARGQFA
jgi:hypothetical protein